MAAILFSRFDVRNLIKYQLKTPFLLLTIFLFAGYVNQIFAKDALIRERGTDPICYFESTSLDVTIGTNAEPYNIIYSDGINSVEKENYESSTDKGSSYGGNLISISPTITPVYSSKSISNNSGTITADDDAIVSINDATIVKGGTFSFDLNLDFGVLADVVVDVILANTTTEAGDFTVRTQQTTAAVSIADISGAENGGDITVTATLNFEVVDGFTVDVNTSDGTATLASDYTAISGHTLTFAGTAGETQTFTLTPTADAIFETDETVSISMNNLLGTALVIDITDGATVTIDNDDAAAVSIADISGAENGGAITVTATLDNAVQGGFTVDVTSADGTATTADSDYMAISGHTLTFAGTAGETQTFTLTPTGDTKLEANETVTITQGNLLATTLAVDITDGATVTIDNDDAAAVSIADISGAENGGAITVTATLDNAVQGGFTVDVTSADGTATTADSDYM
ncbi:Calx-beta domain-containing protein, partial [Ancylomarina sp.]|uniref:Calx-beta domain-containing protein n=1 Tax=Ancylomarina sp. TaxID=1970196 RepID=UPI0035617844